MRKYVLFFTAMFLAGCAAVQKPSVESGNTLAPAPAPAVTPAPAPAVTPTPAPPLQVNTAGLEPFFAAIASDLDGVFLVSDENRLEYARDGERKPVLTGSRPGALAVLNGKALVRGDGKLYWYDPSAGSLTAIDGVAPPVEAVHHGTAFLLGYEKAVSLWTPGRAPRPLSAPEYVFGVTGISLSPDGRYAAVAWDQDIPQGPRTGQVRVYDLQGGAVYQWPPSPTGHSEGLWLLGWSDPQTLRFVTGQRGYDHGHTWQLPDGDPSAFDGTDYRNAAYAWTSPDGAWFTTGPDAGMVAVQSVQPGSTPIFLYKGVGAGVPRILLNGHLAFLHGGSWIEVMPDGTTRVWNQNPF